MPWEQLIAIRDEARQVAQDEAVTPPEACWRDGEPLSEADDGTLFCQACGWTPDQIGGLRS